MPRCRRSAQSLLYLLAAGFLLGAQPASAQYFSRCGGGGRCNETAVMTEAVIGPQMMAFRAGTLVIADNDGFQVRSRAPNGIMYMLARPVSRPTGVERDINGLTYFTTLDKFLFVVTPQGQISPLPVTGINTPYGLTSSGTALYIVDQGWTNRASSGVFRMPIPGGGVPQRCGPAGLLWNPADIDYVRLDGIDWLYIADTANAKIVRLRADCSGTFQTVAGTGVRGWAGDNGSALNANLNFPAGVDVLSTGAFYIADTSNNRIRFVDASGTMHTVMGNGSPSAGIGAPMPGSDPLAWPIPNPLSVAVDEIGGMVYAGVNVTADRGLYCLSLTKLPPIATITPPLVVATATIAPTSTRTHTATPAPTCVPECV